MVEERMHILGLTPSKQIALKLILSNFYKLAVKEWTEFIQFQPTPETLRDKQRLILDTFDIYNEIADICASKHATSSKPKAKLICLAPISIKQVDLAIKSFNPSRSELNQSDVNKVLKEISNLRTAVSESLNYVYTDAEIKKATNQ